jgi:hypothetical protein
MTDEKRMFDRISLRSEFQSLFWSILLKRKSETGFTFKALADALGINKSYVSRSFSSPPNWQIDKISDMADALGVELIVEARDRENPSVIYTASGTRQPDVRPQQQLEVQTGSRKAEIRDAANDEQRLAVIIGGLGAA